MTATATISEAKSQLARAARTFAGTGQDSEARHVVNRGALGVRPAIDDLAQLIQTADQLVETLRVAPSEEGSDQDELLTMAAALRRAAFLLLRREVPEQAWFWTPEWQSGERAADADKRAGRTTVQASDEAFVAALRARRPDIADA